MSKLGLDALPYVDSVNEDYEQYALSLIEAEMTKELPSRHSSSKEEPTRFHSSTLRAAFERLESSPKDKAVTSFVEKGAPAPKPNDGVDAWEAATTRARIAYESERLRGIILDVDKEENSSLANTWKNYNERILQNQFDGITGQVQEQKHIVEELNAARQKDQQDRCGRKLHVLTTQYEELVHKQLLLKQAIKSKVGHESTTV